MTMSFLPYATTTTSIYSVCAVSGIFSACFIGIWNSLIKDEVGSANFYVVYSHSLCVCGFVQFLVTILVVFLVQADPGTEQDYGELLIIFGSIMSMAAIPIFGILICNSFSSNQEDEDCLATKKKLILDVEKASLEAGSFVTIETSLDSSASQSQCSFKSTDS